MTQRVMKKDAKKGQQFKEAPGSTVTYTYREEGEGDGSDRSQVVKQIDSTNQASAGFGLGFDISVGSRTKKADPKLQSTQKEEVKVAKGAKGGKGTTVITEEFTDDVNIPGSAGRTARVTTGKTTYREG
jgi:hypothetical protein